MTIKEFHQGLLDKKFKVKEIAQEYFKKIDKEDKEIGSYLSLRKEEAMKEAEQADKALEKNLEKENWLLGVPLAIKDNILIKGERTTAGSNLLENYIASYDAFVIKKLKEKKAIFLGKTNMDEFAMGSSTESSAFFVTRNPLNKDLVPGGSSGGSAAAVKADLALAGLGSDTGGSIRQPASFCGLVGLKPSYGAVSRFGLIAMASSLDQIGVLAKTVEDAEILFEAIKGKDPLDSTSVEPKFPISQRSSRSHFQFSNLKNSIIGLPKEYFIEGLNREVASAVGEAIKTLENLGVQFKEISLPHTKYALACYYIIMPAEVCSNLGRYDGIRYGKSVKRKAQSAKKGWKEYIREVRTQGFGDEVKRRIILGTFVLSHGYYEAYYLKALKVRTLIKNDFKEVFKKVDAILTPCSPTPPFKIGEKIKDPLAMYLSDIFTVPVNLAGLPAISLPIENFPGIGFQIIGKPFAERDLFNIGKFYFNG